MKIDLVGPARRGLATGLNEAAGYVAVGTTALLTGYLAASHGLRPAPEAIGVFFVAAGFGLSLLVRDTSAHVALELSRMPPAQAPKERNPSFAAVFARTSWRDRSLRGASQAGLVNNLNDGLTWGVFPLLGGELFEDFPQRPALTSYLGRVVVGCVEQRLDLVVIQRAPARSRLVLHGVQDRVALVEDLLRRPPEPFQAGLNPPVRAVGPS
ncbi:hypothetical protein [Streptomyces atratus]